MLKVRHRQLPPKRAILQKELLSQSQFRQPSCQRQPELHARPSYLTVVRLEIVVQNQQVACQYMSWHLDLEILHQGPYQCQRK